MNVGDIMQIRVDKSTVGITGLKQVMEELAMNWAESPDETLKNELLKRLSKNNYIPDRVKENYAKAFLKEFKKFQKNGKNCLLLLMNWMLKAICICKIHSKNILIML